MLTTNNQQLKFYKYYVQQNKKSWQAKSEKKNDGQDSYTKNHKTLLREIQEGPNRQRYTMTQHC